MSGIFTGARQINKESWTFTWQHKKLVLGLISMPVLIDFCLKLFLSEENHFVWGAQSAYLAIVIFTLPWMRYILASHKPTFRSYFTWDKAYLVSMAYMIVLFNVPTFFLGEGLSYVGYPVFTGGFMNMPNLFIWLGVLMLFSLIVGPFSFIFPTVALDKPFGLVKTFRDVLPFYGQYLISSFLALLRVIFIMLLLFAIVFCVILLAVFHPEYIPAGGMPYLQEILLYILLLITYFWVTYYYTILAAYYKKYLMK